MITWVNSIILIESDSGLGCLLFAVLNSYIMNFLSLKMSRKSLILVALGLFALALYAAGLTTGSLVILIAAVGVELWFWFKILASKRNQNSNNE